MLVSDGQKSDSVIHMYVLSWPKKITGVKMLRKDLNELFGQPYIYILFPIFFPYMSL